MEAARRYLKARLGAPSGGLRVLGSGHYSGLRHAEAIEESGEVAKPEWWNDKELMALSARVARAAPNDGSAIDMRELVLCGQCGAWEAGPRSAAQLKQATTH